jgi:hypothetical protein
MTRPAVPKTAGVAGARLWKSVLADFELDEHELTLLRQAVHAADVCAGLQALVESEGLLLEGKAHPALVELRLERILLARLIVALRVPLGEAESDSAGRTPARPLRGVYGPRGVA